MNKKLQVVKELHQFFGPRYAPYTSHRMYASPIDYSYYGHQLYMHQHFHQPSSSSLPIYDCRDSPRSPSPALTEPRTPVPANDELISRLEANVSPGMQPPIPPYYSPGSGALVVSEIVRSEPWASDAETYDVSDSEPEQNAQHPDDFVLDDDDDDTDFEADSNAFASRFIADAQRIGNNVEPFVVLQRIPERLVNTRTTNDATTSTERNVGGSINDEVPAITSPSVVGVVPSAVASGSSAAVASGSSASAAEPTAVASGSSAAVAESSAPTKVNLFADATAATRACLIRNTRNAGYIECPVCSEDVLHLPVETNFPYTTKCGHVFCSICTSRFLKPQRRGPSRGKCPICNEEISSDEMIRLYPEFIYVNRP